MGKKKLFVKILFVIIFLFPIISSQLSIPMNDNSFPKVIIEPPTISNASGTTNIYNNNTYNITNNITTNNYYNLTDYTGIVLYNQTNPDGKNVTLGNGGWFKGLFNWTIIGDWFGWNGAELSFNETKLNQTIASYTSNLSGVVNYTTLTFNTYNSSWDNRWLINGLNQTLNQWNYNQSLATFNMWNSTWDNSWVNVFAYNQTTATFNLYNSTWDNRAEIINVNNTYKNILNSECSVGSFVNGTYINGSIKCLSLGTTYYNATSISVAVGTGAGTLAYIQAYDNQPYNVTEVNSDYTLLVNFTGIPDFTTLLIRHKTSASGGHTATIQLWDYTDSFWEDYGLLTEPSTYEMKTIGVYDSSKHLSGGVVQIKISQTDVGVNHVQEFDWVAISKGFGTPTGQEIDPLSVHRDGTTPLTGNWNAGAYNITANWFEGLFNFGTTSYFTFNGSYLTLNETRLNNTIALYTSNLTMNYTNLPLINQSNIFGGNLSINGSNSLKLVSTRPTTAMIYNTNDSLNPSVDGLYLVPDASSHRVFIGSPTISPFSLNLKYLGAGGIENLQTLKTNQIDINTQTLFLANTSAGHSSITSYFGIEIMGNLLNATAVLRPADFGARTDASVKIVGGDALKPALIVRGGRNGTSLGAIQTGDLQQWVNSSGSIVSSININGSMGVGTSNPFYTLDVIGTGLNVSNSSNSANFCLNGICSSTFVGIVNYSSIAMLNTTAGQAFLGRINASDDGTSYAVKGTSGTARGELGHYDSVTDSNYGLYSNYGLIVGNANGDGTVYFKNLASDTGIKYLCIDTADGRVYANAGGCS